MLVTHNKMIGKPIIVNVHNTRYSIKNRYSQSESLYLVYDSLYNLTLRKNFLPCNSGR